MCQVWVAVGHSDKGIFRTIPQMGQGIVVERAHKKFHYKKTWLAPHQLKSQCYHGSGSAGAWLGLSNGSTPKFGKPKPKI